MKKKLAEFFKGKSVLILGFGLEGRSTLKLLKSLPELKKIGIADIKNPDSTETDGCEIFDGEDYLSSIDEFDIVMKSPGIALLDKISGEQKKKITSQTDLLLRFSDSLIVGVTGTKGKSTTSSLIHHILTACGKKSALIGNIGVPPLDSFYDSETIIVCEMSCHQLEYVEASPDIAVLLNIYEEHLDHYIDFEAYKAAKESIFLYQKENDLLFYNQEIVSDKINSCPSEKFSCSPNSVCDIYISETMEAAQNEMNICGITIPLEKVKTYLPGRHNLYNVMVAAALCISLNCRIDSILEAAASFRGLPHRLEYIGTFNGAEYINDSISTIPRATISAVTAFPDTDTVIIGGMDRKINYDELICFFNAGGHKIKNVIALPDSGWRIAAGINNIGISVYRAIDLTDAVRYSAEVTRIRCILSPAAASYGFYKNFEERGEHFNALVRAIMF